MKARTRYQIAVDKIEKQSKDADGSSMVRMRDALAKVSLITRALQWFVQVKKIWVADNIPKHALTQAVVQYSKKHKLPIVVEDSKTAMLYRIPYGYQEIYAIKELPPDTVWAVAFLREHIQIQAKIHVEVIYGTNGQCSACHSQPAGDTYYTNV